MNHNCLLELAGTVREPNLVAASVFYRHDPPAPARLCTDSNSVPMNEFAAPASSTFSREPGQAPNLTKVQIAVNIVRGSKPLAATVFGNAPKRGKRDRRGGGERRYLPVSFVVKHGIENNEELAHAGGERGLGVLTVGAKPQIEICT